MQCRPPSLRQYLASNVGHFRIGIIFVHQAGTLFYRGDRPRAHGSAKANSTSPSFFPFAHSGKLMPAKSMTVAPGYWYPRVAAGAGRPAIATLTDAPPDLLGEVERYGPSRS